MLMDRVLRKEVNKRKRLIINKGLNILSIWMKEMAIGESLIIL